MKFKDTKGLAPFTQLVKVRGGRLVCRIQPTPPYVDQLSERSQSLRGQSEGIQNPGHDFWLSRSFFPRL